MHINNRYYENTSDNTHIWRISQGVTKEDTVLNWILGLLVFTLPLEGVLATYVGGGIRSLPFYLSIAAVAVSFLRLNVVLNLMSKSTGFLQLIIAFTWSFLMYFYKPLVEHTEIATLVQLFVMSVMFMFVSVDNNWRKRLPWFYWAGWFIFVVLSLDNYRKGNFQLEVHGNITRALDLVGFRANIHAAQTGSGLIISFILLMNDNGWKKQLMIVISILVGLLALLMSNSKGATLSLSFTMLVWFFVSARNGETKGFYVRISMLLIVIIAGTVVLFSQSNVGIQLFESFNNRFVLLFTENDFSSRDVLFFDGLNLFQDNIFGVGQGNSLALLGGIDVHNYYLRVLIDAGIIGLLFFLTGLYLILRRGWIWYRSSGELVFFLPLIFMLVESLSLQGFHYKITWLFLAMNAIVPSVEKAVRDSREINHPNRVSWLQV